MATFGNFDNKANIWVHWPQLKSEIAQVQTQAPVFSGTQYIMANSAMPSPRKN